MINMTNHTGSLDPAVYITGHTNGTTNHSLSINHMTCSEISANLSVESRSSNMSRIEMTYYMVEFALYKVGIPLICIFGILGNSLNLLILTRKQVKTTMNWMEKSAHMGLVALAVSDMLFCVTTLPTAFMPSRTVYTKEDSLVPLYYHTYYAPFVNTFILSSTWLTVVMATGRYFAICHPLHARGFVDLTTTRVAIILIFILSFAFNLPSFWRYYILETKCFAVCECYVQEVGTLNQNSTFKLLYKIVESVLGVFVPIVILSFCNLCLIRALKQSNKIRKLYRAGHTADDSGHKLTPTLVAIIILFIVLVTPSEMLKFVKFFWKPQNNTGYFIVQTVTITTNTMQCLNFAINFVLYCTINVHFRKTMHRFFCCEQTRKPNSQPFSKNCHATVTFNMSDVDAN